MPSCLYLETESIDQTSEKNFNFNRWDENDKSLISHEDFVQSLQQFLPMRVHKFKTDLLLSWLDPKDTGDINYRDFLQMVRDYRPPVPKSGKK